MPYLTRLEHLADDILGRFEASTRAATRPENSQSNAVWVCDEVVLRLAKEPGPGWLSKEAALAPLLPDAVGYPAVLAHGVEREHEWIVSQRIAGRQLLACWDELSADERERALADLWRRLLLLRDVEPNAPRAAGCTTTPFYELDRERARHQLDALLGTGALDDELHAAVWRRIDTAFDLMPAVPATLCHTDAGAHNAMWDGEHAIPLDFEFACVAPMDLELDCLVRHAPDGPDALPMMLGVLADELDRDGTRDRLLGYALLRDVWTIHIWIEHGERRPGEPWPPSDIAAWDPCRRLRLHAEGGGF